VRRYLAEGWNVSVFALPDATVEWLASAGVLVTTGDVASEHDRELAVSRTLSTYGRLDVLINNAGVGMYAPAAEIPLDLFSRLLSVNVVAPLALAQRVIPVMLEQKSGAIVTVGSVAGHVALPWAAAYAASKSALHAIHDALRVELRRSPVHLVMVCPGIVDTDFRKHVLCGQPPERVRHLRWVVPADAVASAIFRAVQRRRKSVYVPSVGALFSLLGTLAPGLMDSWLSGFLPDTPAVARARKELVRARNAGC
jgi:short-subunit dehydrogenase